MHESLLAYAPVELPLDATQLLRQNLLDVRFKRQAARLGLRCKFVGNIDGDYHNQNVARIRQSFRACDESSLAKSCGTAAPGCVELKRTSEGACATRAS